MQPRRSLRLARGRKKKPSDTHRVQADFVVDDAATTAQARQPEPGKFRKLPHSIPPPSSDPWDDGNTSSFDTENLSTNSFGEAMEGTVRHAGYRMHCLEGNKIRFRHPSDPIPDNFATCVQQLVHNERGWTLDQYISAVHELDALGLQCYESQVASFFRKHIFVEGKAVGLKASVGMPMARHLLPRLPTAVFPVSQPRPDLVYGYATEPVFTSAQLLALQGLHEQIAFYAEGCLGLLFPFLTVDFKAAGGTGGDLWTAANQCAGASAACVQVVDQLNTVLGEVGCRRRVLSICYSLAVDNNLAQLYASWRDENDKTTYIQRVDSFLLSNPENFAGLHHRVLAILAWGRGARLKNIRWGLDLIIETHQKAASKLAKSRLVVGPEGEGDGRPDPKRRRQRRIYERSRPGNCGEGAESWEGYLKE